MEKATFAAGCFWGVEDSFRALKGVASTRVGYCGGQLENPDYRTVCGGRTGHAEAVEVIYDPAVIGYRDLVQHFFTIHDPTQVNRQGPDVGTQYRSAIFFHGPEQESVAREFKRQLDDAKAFRKPIATEIVPAGPFYEAEEYHQQYLAKRGLAGCHF